MKIIDWILEKATGLNPHKTGEEKAKLFEALHAGLKDGTLDAASVCLGADQIIVNIQNKDTKHLNGGGK